MMYELLETMREYDKWIIEENLLGKVKRVHSFATFFEWMRMKEAEGFE